MKLGAPSVNPSGIAKAKTPARPPGSDGITVYGGSITSNESNSAVDGIRKWTTYANAVNEATVATGVRYFGNLLAGTEWHVEPNEAGGKNADRGAEIVRAGLIDADMPKPWPMVVRKAAMYRLMGYSIHATATRRRHDGMVVFGEIAHRPQHTIDKWIRKSDLSPWESIEQQTPMGGVYKISLDECLYCVDDTLTDSPEGSGLLRHLIQLVQRLDLYQRLEGAAYQSDMGGLPLARAPLAELFREASTSDPANASTYVDAKTQYLRDAVAKRAKTPDIMQWLMLDSATYQGSDPNTISSIQKWALDTIKSDTNGLPDVNTVIKRIQLEIARVLGIEFAMVGGGDTAGSYGMHEDKTSIFASNLQTTLNELGMFATSQLARRLIMLNGLNPDTCTPKLVAEPISTDAVLLVTQSLANLQVAGLAPDDPARDVLRKRLRLPPEPDRSIDVMLPRGSDPTGGEVISVESTPTDAAPSTVLNGAQVTSLVAVIVAVNGKQISRESAAALLQVAFGIDAATANDLLGPAGFEPAVVEEAPVAKAAASDHPDYGCWSGMIQRCTNPDNKDYKYYGGSGIDVCDRWADDFAAFTADMGPRPTGHGIERVDNKKGYSPSNCKWATQAEQNQNKG